MSQASSNKGTKATGLSTRLLTTRLNKQLAQKQGASLFAQAQDANTPTIVHLGIGAFHRAHQAAYTHKAAQLFGQQLEQQFEQQKNDVWKIIGVSLRSATVANQLNPQDGLYTLVEEASEATNTTLISSISKVIVAPESPEQVVACIADKNVHIVSLTITEKGYCHDPASGELNLEHPDIQFDLHNLSRPKTAIGFLVSGIAQRIEAQLPALTIMSCDNLPDNGHLLKKLVMSFAEQVSAELANKIAEEYCFPCTMVDRIAPAVTPEQIAYYSKKLGYEDQALVVTEPFSQWVIEDNFAGIRPAWDKVGALFVKDVSPFETMKLRLLNGSHSSIAYLGYLANKTYVADVMQVPELAQFIKHIMFNELLPSVSVPDGIDLNEYCLALLERFKNPNLHHKTQQIAMDGSQKLPQRLLSPLEFHLDNTNAQDAIVTDHAQSYTGICFVLAAWMQYVSGVNLSGENIEVSDPLSAKFAELARLSQHTAESDMSPLALASTLPESKLSESIYVEHLLKVQEVFGSRLNQNQTVKDLIINSLRSLRTDQDLITTLRTLLK